MASIPAILLRTLARSVESKIRYEISIRNPAMDWSAGMVRSLTDWLWRQRPDTSPYTYIQFYNVANQTVRNARDAATMQANPQMTILNLGRSPGQMDNTPTYEYRNVIAGYDRAGNELWSTLVYVYSDVPLSGNEVEQRALHQAATPNTPPEIPNYPEQQQSIAYSIRSFIVSAGTR